MRTRTDDLPDAHQEVPERADVINRITVGLIPKVWVELQRLVRNTGLNRTDVVNRAISVYAMVDENLRNGKELVFRDPESNKERIVEIV